MDWSDYWDATMGGTTGAGSSGSGGSSGFNTAATLASGIGTGSGGTSDSGGSGWSSALSSLFGSFKPSDYMDAARLGLAYVNSNKPIKFDNVPLSPEQKKLWDLYLGQATDPKTANNRAQVADYARTALNSLHPTWNSPATSKGETGYAGNTNPLPPFDWSKYQVPGAGASTGTGTTPVRDTPIAGDGQGSGPTGVPGDTFGHVTSPAGSSGDPFANLPSIDGKPIDTSGVSSDAVKGFVSQYGKAGMEAVIALLTSNPLMGLKAAFDAVRAHLAGGTKDDTPAGSVGSPDTANTLSNNPAGAPPVTHTIPSTFAPDTVAFQQQQDANLRNGPAGGADTYWGGAPTSNDVANKPRGRRT